MISDYHKKEQEFSGKENITQLQPLRKNKTVKEIIHFIFALKCPKWNKYLVLQIKYLPGS